MHLSSLIIRRVIALLLSGTLLAALAGCPNGPQRSLSLDLKPTREQIQTSFAIKGTGFTPNQSVTLSLMHEPRRADPSHEIRTVTADGAGSFQTYYVANYPSVPIGPDPGQQFPPTFVARDNASGQSALRETLSAYWYP